MPRVLRTTRRLAKETWTLERFSGVDGQGMPSYAGGVSFDVNVVDGDLAGRRDGSQFIIGRDGSRVVVRKTLYVAGDAENIPDEQDRIGPSTDERFIVAERTEYRGLRRTSDENDHVRLRATDE